MYCLLELAFQLALSCCLLLPQSITLCKQVITP
jgi:hypothetical protein